MLIARPALAEDSTWLELPADGNYNNALNWSPNSVPDSSSDRAVFGQSDTTNVTISALTPVDSWIFTADASNYAFTSTSTLNLLGDGFIINGGSVDYTNDAGGVLHFLNQSSAGNASILNNWTLTFSDDSTAGSATITNDGDGVVTFLEDSSAGDATVLNTSLVRFYDNATAGNASFQNASELYFNDASTAGAASIINNASQAFFANSSAGSAEITNHGLLAFADNSTAASAMITNFGTLQFFLDGSAGEATIENNGLVQLSGAATLGSARLINAVGATIDISALLNAGTTVGSIEGAGAINLGSKSLFTGQNDLSTEFSGDISGTGTLVKQGSGALTLSGVNTYTGSTFVNGGALFVDGSIASSADVNINAGGTLGGEGTVSDILVAGGTVAPGNSIGTLNVAGNVTFNAGSVYEVEVNSAGQSDLIDATGSAMLNGGTVEVVPFPDFALDTQYTVLTAAGGVGGAFDGVDFATASLFLTPELTYGANDVFLTIAQTADFDSAALTPNQIAAAGGAQSLGGGDLFNAIAMLGTVGEAREAFDAVSGEIHASAKTALIEDSRFVREAANDRLRASFSDGADDDAGFWAHGFGATGHTNSDGNAALLDHSIGGVIAGADGEVLDGWRFGLLAGYSHSTFDADDRASFGSAQTYHLGVYGGTEWQNWSLRFGGAYSWHDLDIERTAAFTGFSDNLSSGYSAGTGQVFAELGYGMDVGSMRVEPFANLAHVNLSADGFTESGGAAALASVDTGTHATFATLGLRGETVVSLGEMNAKVHGMIGYRHATADVPTSTHSFVQGGDGFTVAGVPVAGNALLLDAGVDIDIAPNAAVGLAYSGQFGAGFQGHAAKANLSIKF